MNSINGKKFWKRENPEINPKTPKTLKKLVAETEIRARDPIVAYARASCFVAMTCERSTTEKLRHEITPC